MVEENEIRPLAVGESVFSEAWGDLAVALRGGLALTSLSRGLDVPVFGFMMVVL